MAHRLHADTSQIVILLPKILIEIQGREKYIIGLCVSMKGLLIRLCLVQKLLFSANWEGPYVWSVVSGVFGNNTDTSRLPAGSHHALSQCHSDCMSPSPSGAKRRHSLTLSKILSQGWGKGAILWVPMWNSEYSVGLKHGLISQHSIFPLN